MTIPRISCLVPVYNGEAFIEEALRSVLNQSCPDFELIVVDDGSTDQTPDILKNLAEEDKRIVVLRQANGGIVSALNAGLAICRAPYVARMDADDISVVDRFEFQADYLDGHAACVLVGGIARSVGMQGSTQRFTTGGRHDRTDLSIFPPRVAVSMHPLIMMRTGALKTIGGYRHGFPHAEDYDLFIRMAAHGTIDNPPKEVLFYRRHAGALSIRNVETQERGAVQAEVDALKAAGRPEIDPKILEIYYELRVFRRLQTIDTDRARLSCKNLLRGVSRLPVTQIFSKTYARLHGIILYTLSKFIYRRVMTMFAGRTKQLS